MEFFAISLCKKKEYKNESLPIISKDASVKATITSSVSQLGKQGLARSLDYINQDRAREQMNRKKRREMEKKRETVYIKKEKESMKNKV